VASWIDRLPPVDAHSQGERARASLAEQTRFVDVWRDRRWARICLVCGAESTSSREFVCGEQRDYLLPESLQKLRVPLPDLAAQVPVCWRHDRLILWPVRVAIAVYDVLLVDRVQASTRAADVAAGGFTVRNVEGIGL
jgi:hypothetical protein